MLRAVHFVMYGGSAALGMALVAPPAVLWVRSLGMFAPMLLWDVPLGWAFATTALALAACTVMLAVRVSIKRTRGLAHHAALLLLAAAALALRGGSPAPRPSTSPTSSPADAGRVAGFPEYPPKPRLLKIP
jgi:hypothetical protein